MIRYQASVPGSVCVGRPASRRLLLTTALMLTMSQPAFSQGAVRATSTPAQRLSSPPPPSPRDHFVDALLARLTLEEKLGQLAQYRGQGTPTGPTVLEGAEAEIRSGRVGSFLGVYGAAYTRRMQRIAVEETRLHIPLLFAHDVIHGFRTIFPVPLAEASSWNPDAVERSARVAAVEATAAGLHWTFAPMVDIARDPRWGRIVEGSGEDPFLGSLMAAARVRGFQGKRPRGDSRYGTDELMATAKHFVAYGAAEGGRDYNTTDMSERTLREIYLPPFHAAVNAGVGSIMTAFNALNGIPMHANQPLTTGVLRAEWGWNGVVVSDYTGVQELLRHGAAAAPAEAGVLALRSGVDVDMVSGIYVNELPRAVRDGRLPEAAVNAAVRRLLRAKYELGLFADPYRYNDSEREKRLLLAPEHRAAARTMARESIVLLENRGRTLPLAKGTGTLAVIGALADDARSAIGNWAADGRPEEAVTVLEGIRRAVSTATSVRYAKGAAVVGSDTGGFAEAVALARAADAVVLVVGETEDMSAEAESRSSLDLPGVQLELAKAVVTAGKPVVVVLMNGRPLSVEWLAQHANAMLESWFLGSETGHALADVLFGDYNPGGRLPVTFPRSVGQLPLYYNHLPTGRPPDEKEKYTSKYIDRPWSPLYPFGYGLSYTTFRHDSVRVSATKVRATDTLTVSVDVTNDGDRAGDEVVQLYSHQQVAWVSRPVRELRAFRRVSLAPHERKRVAFRLPVDDLAFLDEHMKRRVQPGTVTLFVGRSSIEGVELHTEVMATPR